MREVRADAPGRVNLIGEHTDYHDGYVLPCAIPQRAFVTLRGHGGDRLVSATSASVADEVAYELGKEAASQTWGDYIQGVTWVLQRAGVSLEHGFDLHLRSDVPIGSGLSSSAAILVATLRAVRRAYDLRLSDVDLARLAQRAEVEFVGAPVGIMDQMACSLAGEREALFLDTRTLATERIPLPAALDLVVIDSCVAHQHAGGGYVTRRRESEEAARRLGVERLRDAGPDALSRVDTLPDPLGRRARHVITENSRVLAARGALLRGDLSELGRLFGASHASMRDDYEITVPAVDALVEIASSLPGVFGARMTGGGFGGAIVVAVEAGRAGELGDAITTQYRERTGQAATVLVPRQG